MPPLGPFLDLAAKRIVRRGRDILFADKRRERPDGRELKELQHRHIDADRFAQPVLHLDNLQLVTAKIEEVVVGTDLVDVQDVLPDRGDLLFHISSRCHKLPF